MQKIKFVFIAYLLISTYTLPGLHAQTPLFFGTTFKGGSTEFTVLIL
jgi:hypothetical protein